MRLILTPVLLLFACQQQPHEIGADYEDGELAFAPTERDGGGCIGKFEVKSLSETNWAIQTIWVRRGMDERIGLCAKDFPVRYGEVPTRMIETVPAAELRPGETYFISADGNFSGSFVFEGAGPESPDQKRD